MGRAVGAQCRPGGIQTRSRAMRLERSGDRPGGGRRRQSCAENRTRRWDGTGPVAGWAGWVDGRRGQEQVRSWTWQEEHCTGWASQTHLRWSLPPYPPAPPASNSRGQRRPASSSWPSSPRGSGGQLGGLRCWAAGAGGPSPVSWLVLSGHQDSTWLL